MPQAIKLDYDKNNNLLYQEQWKILNSKIENYYKIFEYEFNIIHTIIELISDNELYTMLSNDSKYNLGHNNSNYSLEEYKELLLPYWFEYLNLSHKEIKKRVSNYDNKKDNLLQEDDKLNIESFIIFLVNNKTIRSKLKVSNLVYK